MEICSLNVVHKVAKILSCSSLLQIFVGNTQISVFSLTAFCALWFVFTFQLKSVSEVRTSYYICMTVYKHQLFELTIVETKTWAYLLRGFNKSLLNPCDKHCLELGLRIFFPRDTTFHRQRYAFNSSLL